MRLHKLLIKCIQMGNIFIEIFDVKVLNAIYTIYQGNTVYAKWLKTVTVACRYTWHKKQLIWNLA